jgi:general secretion pathway protein H
MWRAGSENSAGRQAGFTLFEMLVVMAILAMAFVAVSAVYKRPSQGVEVKAAARLAASRLRDMRAAAMNSGTERSAYFDVNARTIRFGDGRAPQQLSPSIRFAVVGADSERAAPDIAGVRFFPNGSSSGATITMRSERQGYEVRINWLTGRVSVNAVD